MAVEPITPPAAAVPADQAPAAEQAVAAAPAAPPSKYASVHTLFMRIDDVADLPLDVIWLRDEHGILQPRSVKVLTAEQVRALKAAVAAGQVYAIWGHRYQELEDLTPDWHCAKRSHPSAPPA